MPGVPKPPSRETVELADQLALRIAQGHFLDYLPGERRLAEHLNVPLRRIRHAVALLEKRGLVERIPARGTRLRARDDGGRSETLFDRIVLVALDRPMGTVFFQQILGRLRRWADRLHAVTEPLRGWSDERTDPLAAISSRQLARSAFVFAAAAPDAALKRLRQHDRPFVLIEHLPDDGATGVNAALLDHRNGVALAVEHLTDLGHRRIAMAGNFEESWVFRERLAGFREGLARRGLAELPELHVKYVDLPGDRYDLFVPLRAVLGRPDRPTALVAVGGTAGLDILKICAHDRIAVPGQLSVVAVCSTIPEASRAKKPTTVEIGRPQDLADIAASLLLRPGSEPEPLVLRPMPRMQVRKSTGPPPH